MKRLMESTVAVAMITPLAKMPSISSSQRCIEVQSNPDKVNRLSVEEAVQPEELST